ncbi:CopY/TcrY family copper transport repressor [Enterococcus bulliens]
MATQKENQVISEAEWQVMRVIWTKRETTAKEIYEAIHEPLDWKLATVKTLLGRLVTKEWIETTKEGKRFIYSPLISQESAMERLTEDFLARICAKNVGQTLANMIQNTPLSQTDLALLKTVLANKQVTEITCSCLPGQCNCHH